MSWLRRLFTSRQHRVDLAWNQWLDDMQAGLRADREVILTEENYLDPPWSPIRPWIPPR